MRKCPGTWLRKSSGRVRPISDSIMPGTVDLNQLLGLVARRGERVIVVVPGQEPIVLVPVSEYERLMAGTVAQPVPEKSSSQRVKTPPAAPKTLEAVDPPQGSLTDDDQYYPEPLE